MLLISKVIQDFPTAFSARTYFSTFNENLIGLLAELPMNCRMVYAQIDNRTPYGDWKRPIQLI